MTTSSVSQNGSSDQEVAFSKLHGLGNDFIVVDNRDGRYDFDESTRKNLCRRRIGIGADGIIEIVRSTSYNFRLLYFNADGKEGSLCGNGARCAIMYCVENGVVDTRDRIIFEAFDGIHEGGIDNVSGLIYVKFKDVQKSSIVIYDNDSFFIDTGSPHIVNFVPNIDDIDVQDKGRKVRNSDAFKKHGVNVNFAQISPTNDVKVRTYERGVEDETFACGTGAVATAIALVFKCRHNLSYTHDFNTIISFRYGDLFVSFTENISCFEHIKLIGPACHVFDGSFKIA